MGKIDLSKFTEALKGFASLRSYYVLLWPAVIVLASAGVMTAALMMGSSFGQKMNKESLPLANEVKKMLDSSPAISQAEVEARYEQQYQADANKIARLAEQSTERELLSYDIFPAPKESSSQLFTQFGDRFCKKVDGLTAKVSGRDCPSDEELKRGDSGTSSVISRMPMMPATGGDDFRIIDEICQARAKSASVYVNPADISGYDFWEQYKYSNADTGVKDCWYWQLGYWIIEDVFSTVGTLNAGSNSVYTSPVKRVIKVGFTIPGNLFGSDGKTTSQDAPKYVIKPEDQLSESCTARLSNENIDVVHFSIVAVVRLKDVMTYMKELCGVKEHQFMGYDGKSPVSVFRHNQISILESQIRPIDFASREHQNYRYGPDPVVEVDLVCEYVFNKNGYVTIKPDLTKLDAEPKN
jgi:hypothetical protein